MPSTKVFVLLSLLTLAVFTIPLQHDIKETFDRLRSESNGQLNQRPIIGVLAQPSTQPNYPPEQYNFIAASYIKFVESAGARAVPIQWDLPQADLAKLMNQVNGLLLPGGSNDATDEQGHWTPYFYVNKFLVEQAEKMNRNGVYFPIWATCQGYQYLSQIYANDSTVLGKDFNDLNINHNQTFTSIAKTSRLYSGLPDWMRTHMETQPAVNYYHNYGVEPKVFQSNSNLMNSFNVLSTSKTATGREFIAAFEHKMFPFYGVQFHPEKSIYEWLESNGATHTPEAIAVTQYMENFFNLEARKNLNKFESAKEEYDALIYNFQTVQTNVAYVQSYFFKTHNSTTGVATRGGWVSDI